MVAAGLLAKQRRGEGPDLEAVGQDVAGAGLEGRHGVLRRRPGWSSRSRRSASTSSATAARPASGTPGRCPEEISKVVNDEDLAVASVLSGNRNFEGRINPDVKMNFLASPPLVRRLRAGRDDVLGPVQRPDRRGLGRRGGLPQGHLAVREGGRPGRRGLRALGDVHVLLRRGLRRRRQLARPRRARRATASPGTRTRPTCSGRRS